MDVPRQNLRLRALQKIAALSTTTKKDKNSDSDLHKLYAASPRTRNDPGDTLDGRNGGSSSDDLNGVSVGEKCLSRAPMTLEELQVLVALCNAGPQIDDQERAVALLNQLGPYLLEAHDQVFAPSPFLRAIEPSPWEVLTHSLVFAVLAIGIRHTSLHGTIYELIIGYLHRCWQLASWTESSQIQSNGGLGDLKPEQTFQVGAATLSILGFLEAASAYFHFYSVSERQEVVALLKEVLNDSFMVLVEGTFSSIRTTESMTRVARDWKQYTKRYASSGRPLGAMLLQRGFMRMLVSCSSLQVLSPEELQHNDILDCLMSRKQLLPASRGPEAVRLTEVLSEIAIEQMRRLEDGADYQQLGSAWQQHLAFTVKSHALTVFLCCMIIDEEIADTDVLMTWLEESMADRVEMADESLATTVLKSMTIVAQTSPAFAASLSRLLPRLIVQSEIRASVVIIAARCLAIVLRLLSQDAVITSLYSLGNVLSTGSSLEKGLPYNSTANGSVIAPGKSDRYTQQPNGSAISFDLSGEEETSAVYGNVILAIVNIVTSYKDNKMVPLALSMLLQKLGRVSLAVDLQILVEAASLAARSSEVDLRSLLKLYDRFSHEAVVQNNTALLETILKARVRLTQSLTAKSPLFQVCLIHLLQTIVSIGDVDEGQSTHQADVDLAAKEICQVLRPLAILSASGHLFNDEAIDEELLRLQRDVWFNFAVHGITMESPLGKRFSNELRTLALHSRPLVADGRIDQNGSDIELNTVLRRGMKGPYMNSIQSHLAKLLPDQEYQIKALSYPRVAFLHAAYMVEMIRAEAGHCADVLVYFTDPSVYHNEMGVCMVGIADLVMTTYLKRTLSSLHSVSFASQTAGQLAIILTNCCHRMLPCQHTAARLADRLIDQLPSSLCQKTSLFALLELLTLMWSSCLEAEIDEYEWKSIYVSTLGNVSLEPSDDFPFRRTTLENFHRRAKNWVMRILEIAPLDVRGLLQTYLSEYDDDGAVGHVALGRSFALEMGSLMPPADQRLGAIDIQGDVKINTASDFIAQYTTRQEYKHADALPERDSEWIKFLNPKDSKAHNSGMLDHEIRDAQSVLATLDRRINEHKVVAMGEVRDVLRRAAALLCRTEQEQCMTIQYLVGIPFALFTKQSMKLGISLWLGVINEKPHVQPRIIMEIAKHWERTIELKMGIFDKKFHHVDPFYVKEEFAPSDKAVLLKRQQVVHNLITPHLRVLQFLTSHYHANRLGSPHLRRIFQRLIRITVRGLKNASGHPLAREFHFHVILFGLMILRYSIDLGEAARWRLKDSILSAALAWFSHPPRWSFGGNRLQVKAETRLMVDVEGLLNATASIGANTTKTLQSLKPKQELLIRLLENEHTRLQVWLFPIDHEKGRVFSSYRLGRPSPVGLSSELVVAAWLEDPAIAIQLCSRFQFPMLAREVRQLILRYPEKAIEIPDALHILLDNGLPADAFSQLKYLLYWAPVNPITAVTYCLPAYGNHPFIIQYAMRALESHSVDVTFFYVPQIVQTLRYDSLGYVQRYILETAKFSQLFAHQIVWNIKANSYKDEDSKIEDPVKPILDQVVSNMISTFSGTDRTFYEREFAFFKEITDISGKLRPFIKKSKAEKKEKIEEELRKIKVEIGVYLPSNPDGVVVGIDRKSGKPLQSHAKAPYMATFRIKKNKGDMEGTDSMLENTQKNEQTDRNGPVTHENTYEVWQSAIFKVGDDCRQDVLALQMIAAFRGIFNNVGLDVYVYPYRVTATAPGCGVIDVLPNSISRDMIGRETVNGLYDYFAAQYGGEHSIRFQQARNNFVKSMAAYSVISYLLQLKDRHNGNIMIDDAGHILHIDFGFCFDIAPGGIKFERAPFKLTGEMVAVMGGSTSAQPFQWFEELCVKAFLASRLYTEKLCHMVVLMLDSGLPCFKPETIKHFRERFVLEKSEREAADFMRFLIRSSNGSRSTKVYDQFQLMTNGIPY